MENETNKNDDFLIIVDDENSTPEELETQEKWKVLIVDDDIEIHKLTIMVLSKFSFKEKQLDFLSAYSEKEAITMIDKHPDIFLIYLDVVMENENSGLNLVKYIRNEKNNFFVRIVLRTGQPGQAPEEKIIRDYDINDYKEKTELTARKLYTTTISSLRSYLDLKKIDNNRKGLEKIIECSANMFEFKSSKEFITGVLRQLISILGLDNTSVFEKLSSFAISKNGENYLILAATGKYCKNIDQSIVDIQELKVKADLELSMTQKKNLYFEDRIVLYIESKCTAVSMIYMEGITKLDEFERELVEIFVSNVSITYDNIYLNKENEETQREIIFGLGEISEARSKETGRHVKRVAEYSKLLALEYGLSNEEAAYIYLASTMHDVGKLAIPDSIINKPGKLTEEEFNIVKQHTSMGFDMLKKSTRPVMKMAAIIALQHHEKFNGSGYPNSLKEDNIHIAGRIVALADVFDALGSKRVYKSAWNLEDILELLKKEKAEHFDPKLIDIFINNLDEFVKIRENFCD